MFNLKKTALYIDSEIIKNNISDEDVFAYFLNYTPEIGKYYKSPFRKDNKAGCRFERFNNQLFFVENSGYKNKVYWDAFSLGKELTRKSLPELYLEIYNKRIKNKNVFVLNKELNKQNENKFQCLIKFQKENWDIDNYFSKNFNIDVDWLQQEPVFCFKKYWVNSKKNQHLVSNLFGTQDIQIAYYFPESQHTKLYFPNATKDQIKWYSNCDDDDIFNFHKSEKFTSEKPLYITKSGKDCLILDFHLNIQVIAVQQENGYLPRKIIELILNKNLKPILIYDNSESDKPKVYQIIEKYKDLDISAIFYPDETKDTAEYYLRYGSDSLKNYINDKK